MNELYRSVLKYAATKNKEIVFVDVTSSLDPLDGNHTSQIEPNGCGSQIMGILIAEAVACHMLVNDAVAAMKSISVFRMNREALKKREILEPQDIQHFAVKKINRLKRGDYYY